MKVTRCQVAYEPVVVMKSRPVKPGNGVEGKTEMNSGLSRVVGPGQKRGRGVKG